MSGTNLYRGLIFTNHALQRMRERELVQEMAWKTFHAPDIAIAGKNGGTNEFRKQFRDSIVTVIARQNEQKQWVVLSCWIDPPLPGTKDYRERQYYYAARNAGFWGKIWLEIKKQLGL